ncbi:dual specificity protein phosphatase family protein [Streptomyces qinzhouensis]|uniref:Dual specificity protein phosphatase family protein n=1 Tax=Streptomyces qinzhouensis TaxID=2599401 RepID=A0A5B8JN80_9ACTN|nr:dual specificity protein phosphatase family protein [Streptomyces qinzhouensis]QDY81391.1 dual specificity protein phosphatase family protein [Streptomyces qinzhouensis]
MPGPQAPWDEIVPGLWMGGHYWTDPAGELQPVVVGGEFDLVVSLFTRSGHGPQPGTEHLVAEIPDAPLSADQIGAVQQLAHATAHAVQNERTALVRCHSGYNRSGLVVAQALIHLGWEAATVIQLVQERRSPWALNNAAFRSYLTSGLDVARLLTGLRG